MQNLHGFTGLETCCCAESLPPQPRGRGRPRKASKGSTPASKALKGQQGSAAASCQGSARLQGALAAVRRAWTRFAAALLWVHAIASMGSCRDGVHRLQHPSGPAWPILTRL